MNQIDKLKAEIAELENSVDSTMSKEVMYDVLVQAFFKAKDIIELYKDVNPVEQDCPEDVSTELAVVNVELKSAQQSMHEFSNNLTDVQGKLDRALEDLAIKDSTMENIKEMVDIVLT